MEMPQNCRKRKWQNTKPTIQPQSLNCDIIEKKRILRTARSQPGLKGKLIFMYNEDKCNDMFEVLSWAASCLKKPVKLMEVKSEIRCNVPTWNLYLGEEIVASGEYPTKVIAREALSREAVEDFRRYCFTLIRKTKNSERRIEKDGSIQEAKTETETPPKANLTVAEKMMMKMGWTGGGLGAQEQGIAEAIKLQEQIDKRGFGAGGSSSNIISIVSGILDQYAKSGNTERLVFSKEYTREERKRIHQVARKYNLKSKSFGKGEDRYLVISNENKKWILIERIIEKGGETDNYKLIFPTDL